MADIRLPLLKTLSLDGVALVPGPVMFEGADLFRGGRRNFSSSVVLTGTDFGNNCNKLACGPRKEQMKWLNFYLLGRYRYQVEGTFY